MNYKIDFNLKDINISSIKRRSKLFNLKTKMKYYVFGLKQTNNCLIVVEHYNYLSDYQKNTLKSFYLFLLKNKLSYRECFNFNKNKKNDIYIGLRLDLRNYIVLSSCLLETLIYGLEGKLDIDVNFKILNVPEFENNDWICHY